MPRRPVAVFAIAPWAFGGVFPADLLARLRQLVDIDPTTTFTSFDGPAATAALAEAEILITGWGCPRIDAAVLSAAPRLRALVHAAGTVKAHVDPVVFESGVVVSSAAEANAVPVADYTIAMLVLGAKQVFSRARRYAAATAGTPPDWLAGDGTGLHHCTVGVVGASRIGRHVLRRLRRFDVEVLLYDPYVNAAEAARLGAEPVGLDDLCRRSHLVTVHAPALPETRHMLDARRLDLLPENAVVVNTARGSLIDTQALTRACATGRISAILDVTDPEPLPPGHPLLAMPNVLVTPHLAGAQGRELRRLGDFAVAEVDRLLNGAPLVGRVEPEHLPHIA
ncbi:phosphoglycerate dehydrogenase-like enzyme [Thermocatellispora tengchongensis]|uniref:Phosphoglycerate dehydrogenase-like enzyme n=1 Tax=Thermocatellispora tengchongensis TaxID=1073253 RepID=A0A840PRR6_9ACTN|nr:hydroxyacid dehydrogenase [Thermocatellispora tengchongensis]MBB5140480.1 phosphoglycerate dehydrogenase-like enzyme [Thermocatellispora tengchongensis]